MSGQLPAPEFSGLTIDTLADEANVRGNLGLGAGLGLNGVPRFALPAPVSGVITLPFATAGDICYEGVITANVTIALSGGSATYRQKIVLDLIQDSVGGRQITWPTANVLWSGGAPPNTNTPGTLPQLPGTPSSVEFVTRGTAGQYKGKGV